MLGRHLLYYLPVNVAQAVVGFGAIFVLTRILSAGDYGYYAQAMAALSLVHVPVSMWLEAAAARFYARAEARGRLADHFATLYGVFAPVALGFVLIAGAGLWLAPLSAEVKTLAGFGAGALIARSAMKIFQETRRAAQDVALYGVFETIHILGGFLLGVGLILGTPLRAAGPFAGMLIATVICVAIEAPNMLRRGQGGRVDGRRAAAYLRYGAPLAVSNVLFLIISVSDRFLVAGFLGEEAAGVYSAGYALADRTLDIMFVWVGMAAGPLAIALLERKGAESARGAIRAQGETMLLLTMPAATGLALVAGPLTEVMTGEAFRAEAAGIVPWIAAAAFIGGFTTYYLDQSLELARKTYLFPLILAVPATINIGLNLVLLPVMGLMGAVIATLAAYSVGAVTTFFVGRRHFALPLPWAAAARIAISCAAMALAVLALPPLGAAWLTLLIHAGLGAAVFAAAALALDAGPARPMVADLIARVRRAGTAEPEAAA